MRAYLIIAALLMSACGEPPEPLIPPPAPPSPCAGADLSDWTKRFWRDEPLQGDVVLRPDSCGGNTAAEMTLTAPPLATKEMFLSHALREGIIGQSIQVSARFRLLEGAAQFGVSIDTRATQIGQKDGIYQAVWPDADVQTKDVRLWLYAYGGQTSRVLVDQVQVSVTPGGSP